MGSVSFEVGVLRDYPANRGPHTPPEHAPIPPPYREYVTYRLDVGSESSAGPRAGRRHQTWIHKGNWETYIRSSWRGGRSGIGRWGEDPRWASSTDGSCSHRVTPLSVSSRPPSATCNGWHVCPARARRSFGP